MNNLTPRFRPNLITKPPAWPLNGQLHRTQENPMQPTDRYRVSPDIETLRAILTKNQRADLWATCDTFFDARPLIEDDPPPALLALFLLAVSPILDQALLNAVFDVLTTTLEDSYSLSLDHHLLTYPGWVDLHPSNTWLHHAARTPMDLVTKATQWAGKRIYDLNHGFAHPMIDGASMFVPFSFCAHSFESWCHGGEVFVNFDTLTPSGRIGDYIFWTLRSRMAGPPVPTPLEMGISLAR